MSSNQNTKQELITILEGCKQGKRHSQKLLYKHFYGYAMSICMRYGQGYDHAVEIVNDGFLKVFTKLDMYNSQKSFKAWLRRIMINSAVDHYRKEIKHESRHQSIENLNKPSTRENVLDKMAFDEVVHQIQLLPPSYRAVFNLFVFEGFKHEEIGKMLNISEGTSKSNLSRARAHLQRALGKIYNDELA